MHIVIIGAGAVGGYLAEILSKEQFNVILIDKDIRCLESLSQDVDVAIRHGNGTDWQLLDDLLELSPELLIAVTGSDEANLVACAVAKELGYVRTIARVRGRRYLSRSRLDFGRLFHADDLVGPEQLVADDMYKYMSSPGSLAVEHFAHGAVQLRTIVVPEKWRRGDVKLRDLKVPEGMMVGLLRRPAADGKKRVIFPHGNDSIHPGDEVTVIGETDVVSDVHYFFGSSQRVMESVVIVGGSLTALNLASILERKGVAVRIIEHSAERCRMLAERLTHAVVICDDGTSLDVLQTEKVDRADLVVACTEKDELNIMVALLAKEAGCPDALIMMSDTHYTPLVEKLGISHTVSPRISAANRILSLVREQTVTSMVSVYDHQAEIVELQVSSDSQLVGIPISELGPQLPKDFLIAVIQNRGRIMIANGNRILSPGDTVCVVTHPKHINDLERVF